MAISIPPPAEVDPTAVAVDTVRGSRSALGRIPTRRGRLVVAGGTAALLAVILMVASRSSLFALRHVEISGGGHRSAAEIRARAGLPDGVNVVWLDTAAVAARLEADPWIAAATVSRSLPWSIDIRVSERSPVAVLVDGASGTYLAADGTGLGRASGSSRLPRIVLPPAAPATMGIPGEGGALRALDALSPSVRHRVREIDVAVGGTLTVRLRAGTVVALGHAVELDDKARALRRVLAWEQMTGTRLGRISLVAPTAPAASVAG